MIKAKLKTLIAKIEEEKSVRITFEELGMSCGLTRQTVAKLAKNQTQNIRISHEQYDKMLKKLNSYGYSFNMGDLLEYIEEEGQLKLAA